MCGSMKIGDTRVMLNSVIRVHGIGADLGRSALRQWTGWCRQESLDAGIWESRIPRDVFIPVKGYWEKDLFYPISEDFVLAGVTIIDPENPSRRIFRVVTRLVEKKEIEWAELHRYPVHDRHPLIIPNPSLVEV